MENDKYDGDDELLRESFAIQRQRSNKKGSKSVVMFLS